VHFVVSCGVGFGQFGFLWLIELSFNISFKPKSWLLVAIAPNIACSGFGSRLFLNASLLVSHLPLAEVVFSIAKPLKLAVGRL
jgi:hypothetical protein